MKKLNVYEEAKNLAELWKPKKLGELENMDVKVGKIHGAFIWHKHDEEDEMFYILSGRLIIKFRDKDITLNEHDFLIIPKGVEHMPVANEEVCIMLIEPKTTLNTGNVINERTVMNE